jgi:Amidohydrolase
VLIDAHTHILSLAEDAEFTTEYGREGSLCIYRSLGKLPAHRAPTEQEWESSGYSRRGFPVIGPAESIRDHPGFDKIVILAVSPQFLEGELIGTVDSYGITGVPGPSSPADPVLAFPVFEKAEELGIPVMVHQAGSTRIDARMEYARPALLDAAGRHFRELRLTIAHCGLPWVDEALFMLTKHPNFFAELSYYIATVTPEELFRFLVHAQQSFVPLEKLFFGTDYPGFLYDPVELRAKLLSVNDHAERVGSAPIPQAKLDGILGDNYARMLGLLS